MRPRPARTSSSGRFGRAGPLLLGALTVGAASCIVRTDFVPAAFNNGALDSKGDPFREPAAVRAEVVERLVWDEVIDGYFGQGSGSAPGHQVAPWLQRVAQSPTGFLEIASCAAFGAGPRCALAATTPEQGREEIKTRLRALTAVTAGEAVGPMCEGFGRPNWPVFERVLDEIRFRQAIARAARSVGEVLQEGLVDETAVLQGAERAFQHAAQYIGDRRWRRERDRHTTGLVVKGGAATGIFSAGVVWSVLHLIHGCMSDPTCGKGRDLRFKLLSGTSTGAMITTAVDRFNSATTAAERRAGLDDIPKWFTCYSLTDLFCVRSAPITRLFDIGDAAQKGVLEFDGIRKVLSSCVDERMQKNRSELILNTVEFRTGALYALSDQAELRSPACVVEAALASSLLPVIANPVVQLPVGLPYDPTQLDATEPSFLDGGIRSEIPLMPLARRGAERVLVVSSANSILGGTHRLRNALEIAQRYIDVSVGGVTESDLVHAKRHAESVRQAEIEACRERLREGDALCPPDSPCDAHKICETRAWSDACSRSQGLPPPSAPEELASPPPAPAAEDANEAQRVKRLGLDDTDVLAPPIEPFWRVMGVFRNESSVDSLNGYNFEPAELRRLFRAGAEQGRLRCLDIARLLGIPSDPSTVDAAMEAKLVRWCSPELPKNEALCGGITHAEGFRSCDQPAPDTLNACGVAPPLGACQTSR
ncbi:patatin-like phospholipase family protein [Chondromyces crocatus]|uniref:PNPLA domain-containing protein n=1 Tax=Chondromyces crocatus TaxID=52 RepID=A0A0K1E6L4_CHOCO|nr:patatin-like phospholipase family protein [Chondromyces crocatus]AKT36198.1 uncharacterized protein CMC5_003120 [Chondromyces crocatus]